MYIEQGEIKKRFVIYMGLLGIAICALFTMIVTSHYIYLYSQEPIALTGQLGEVHYHTRGLEIDVDGNPYVVYQPRSSVRTFGFKDDINREKMYMFLDWQKGKNVSLEYIQITSNQKNVVGFTVNGIDYVDRNEAVTDFVEGEKLVRGIAIILFILASVCIYFTYKGKIRIE